MTIAASRLSALYAGLVLSCWSTLPGQLEVSPKHAATPGDGAGLFPGAGVDFRLHVLIAGSRLGGAANRTITELHVRRAAGFKGALASGQADVKVLMSVSRRSPANPSQLFAENVLPVSAVVFDGVVAFPASPAIQAPVVDPWAPNRSVRIPFTTGFAYTGGDLCIEIRGRPRTGSTNLFWPVDHEAQLVQSAVSSYGRTCGNWTPSQQTVFGSQGTLRIGGTTWLWSFGRPQAMPLMLMGLTKFDPGIELTPIGAPGCRQYLAPMMVLPMVYNPPLPGMTLGTVALPIKLPADGALVNSSFVVQFMEDERTLPRSEWSNPLALSTSNGLSLTVSGQFPNLGLATVSSRGKSYGRAVQPDWGEVSVSSAPIMRLTVQ